MLPRHGVRRAVLVDVRRQRVDLRGVRFSFGQLRDQWDLPLWNRGGVSAGTALHGKRVRLRQHVVPQGMLFERSVFDRRHRDFMWRRWRRVRVLSDRADLH